MQLKDFQDTAINELRAKLYLLWRGGHRPARLVFKAPTGAGKTVMAAELLNRISGDAQFDPDKAFIWFSFNPDSVGQSRRKLHEYLNGGIAGLYDTDEISQRGKLKKNDVLFVNWQKLVARRAETKRLRQDGEANISFDTFIANTKADGREIIVIIDECHLAKSTDLAGDILRLVDPRIELLISATPLPEQRTTGAEERANQALEVEVDQADVIASGIIKRAIRLAPREEIEELVQPGSDLDYTILDLAITKRLELAAAYKAIGARVNPLVLIKLPNDDRQAQAAAGQDKLTLVRKYLAELGIPDSKIAVWLTGKKENLAAITDNESSVEFLIFKQAAATGWDCPRADVLVMFREIESPVFETQILGRILRTAEGKHYPSRPDLNHAYLYTSYERATVVAGDRGGKPNAPRTNIGWLKPDIDNISLPSIYITRVSYNDLGHTFQATFAAVADKHYGLTGKDRRADMDRKLTAKGLDLSATSITNQLIVDANIEVFDDFLTELAKNPADLPLEASRLDLQKLYTNLLWHELAQQTEDDCKYAPERSWNDLKSALNVYFRDKLQIPNPPLYAIICNDLQKGDASSLRPLITRALKTYRPIRAKDVAVKSETTRTTPTFSLRPSYSFTDDAVLFEVAGKPPRRAALQPAFVALDSPLEGQFLTFVERSAKHIDWWFKNGNYGSDYLAIPYHDAQSIERLFYPDFIIKQGKRVVILDTKAGLTAEDHNAKAKAAALQTYIETADTPYELWGGIVVPSGGMWKINTAADYHYDPADLSDWQDLSFS